MGQENAHTNLGPLIDTITLLGVTTVGSTRFQHRSRLKYTIKLAQSVTYIRAPVGAGCAMRFSRNLACVGGTGRA